MSKTPTYYYGFFRSLDTSKDERGQLYKVSIITDFSACGADSITIKNGGEITLSNDAFMIDYSAEECNIYKQYKCSSATVSFLQETVNPAFNDASGNNVFVRLLKAKSAVTSTTELSSQTNDSSNFDTVWSGYATPNAYTQPFVNERDLFQLECQDALSTLKYAKMKRYVSGGYISFKDVILKMLSRIRAIKDVYITNAIKVNGVNALNVTSVNLENWFDEDNEPSDMMTVLSEMLKYYNLTAIQSGDVVYIIQYDGLMSSSTTYSHYSNNAIESGNRYYLNAEMSDAPFALVSESVKLSQTHIIKADDFAGPDTNITLESVFNRLTVKSNFYNYPDEIRNDVADTTNVYDLTKWKKTTKAESIAMGNSENDTRVIRVYRDSNPRPGLYVYYSHNGWQSNNITFVEWYNRKTIGGETIWDGEMKYVDSHLVTYTYRNDITNRDSGEWVWYPQFTERFGPQGACLGEWMGQASYENAGACIVRYYNHSFSGENEGRNWKSVLANLDAPKLSTAIYMTGIRNTLATNTSTNYPKNERETCKQKFFKYTTDPMTLTGDTLLVISGSMTFYDGSFCLPVSNGSGETIVGDDNYFYCRIRCGERYYNGDEWQNTECDCKIYLSARNGEAAFYRMYKFQNSGQRWWQTYDGYTVKAPADGLVGEIEFTMYRCFGLAPIESAELVILEDFSFALVSEDDDNFTTQNTEKKTDNEYTNILDDSAVEEMEDVEFKITTGDDRHLANYSNARLMSGTSSTTNITTVVNSATGCGEIPEIQYLYNMVNQYKTPTLVLECALRDSLNIKPYSLLTYHFFDGKYFVVDSQSVDVANDINTLRLVEKKQFENTDKYIKKQVNKDVGRNGRLLD